MRNFLRDRQIIGRFSLTLHTELITGLNIMKNRLLYAAIAAAMLSTTTSPQADAEEWQPLGTGSFTDGWILPHFKLKATWDVEIMKSATADRYLISDPYHQSGFTDLFDPGNQPNTPDPLNIVVDCTDPDYVTIEPTHIFTFAEGQFDDFAPTHIWGQTRAMYLETIGYSRSDLIGASLNSMLANGTITLRQCVIGYSPEADQCNSSISDDGSPHDTIIALPAADTETITFTESDTPALYFNLLGQQVANPQCGQLLIKRIGATAKLTLTGQ